MTVNDERDDERVDDGDHEELGRDEVVGEFPEKKVKSSNPAKKRMLTGQGLEPTTNQSLGNRAYYSTTVPFILTKMDEH